MSSDEEFYDPNPQLTRYGRKTIPRTKETVEHNTGNTIPTEMAQFSDDQFRQLMDRTNQTQTIITTDTLPVYRGKKRPADPQFEDKNTLQQHIKLIDNHIEGLTDQSEARKKQVLLRSADTKLGDFHITITNLLANDEDNEITYEQLCNTLKDIYVQKQSKDIYCICKDILDQKFVSEDTVQTQLVESITKLNSVAKYVVEDTTINFQIPVKLVAETHAQYSEKIKKLVKSAGVNMLFLANIAPKLNPTVVKKVTESAFKTTLELTASLQENIRKLPEGQKVILPGSRNIPREHETYVIHEVDEDRSEIEHDRPDLVETYFSNQRGRYGNRYPNRGTYTRGNWHPQTYTQSNYTRHKDIPNRGTNTYIRATNTRNSVVKDNGKRCYNCGKIGHFSKYCQLGQNKSDKETDFRPRK